jgi:hypothetical protein
VVARSKSGRNQIRDFDKLRKRKATAFKVIQELNRGLALNQNDIILPAEKLGQILQIGRQQPLMSSRSKGLALGDIAFSEGVENKDSRRAAARLGINVKSGNEIRIKAGGAPTLDI